MLQLSAGEQASATCGMCGLARPIVPLARRRHVTPTDTGNLIKCMYVGRRARAHSQ
jgi:hypothetical protein